MHKASCFVLGVAVACYAQLTQADLAQEPLYLGAGNVPGNLAIVPSVEFPTVDSVANLDDVYSTGTRYVGYFDSAKCYDYAMGSGSEPERYFKPTHTATNMRCPGPFWSGNYLNWAATQTIDPFRLALTGGLRVNETPSRTWVEKARHYGRGSFPTRTVTGNNLVADLTPFDADSIRTYIQGKGKDMEFELTGNGTIQGTDTRTISGVEKLVYDFSDRGWIDYKDGEIKRDNKFSGRRNVIVKKENNDPDGGYTNFNQGVNKIGRNFVLTGWFAYEGGGGSLVRFAVSDDDANGYGPSIGDDSITIERRNSGNANQLSGTARFNREDDEWYWFEFRSDSDNTFTLTVAENEDGKNSVSITSAVDDEYQEFTRIYIHGGHKFYLDDLRLVAYEADDGQEWPYETVGGRYKAAVRVEVCAAGMLEANCKQYANGWKPEGLMQEYADRIRYSVFGYLNDDDARRDGGVMRARQKFIGLLSRDPDTGWEDNVLAEWNSNTGVLERNPDASDATATQSAFGVVVNDSGALNYINKFGELNGNSFKSLDPVSELYYSATRYFRGLPQVPTYDAPYPGWGDNNERAKWVDGFPVIRSWDDPIQYSCQKNVILGIGDVNTHRDQNLPGSPISSNEPSRPNAVKDDKDIDVDELNRLVGKLEGLNLNDNNRFGSTRNAGYMIGLAFDANTRDIRPEDTLPGKQTIQTYWVDVLENRVLQNVPRNQYWLTAKYGGFVPRCPENNPTCTLPTINGPEDVKDIPENWWYTNGDVLSQGGTKNLKRADNYYAAGQADKMVEGLRKAFADIAASMRSTASSLSFNSTRLRSGSYVYQALFDNTRWSGDLQALAVSSTGVVAATPKWSAAVQLDALSNVAQRVVITASPLASAGNGDGLFSTTGKTFTWGDLSISQQDALKKNDEAGGTVSATVAQDRVSYVRGDRSREQQDNFRNRDSRLGDIINSDPQYIFNENFGYSELGQGDNGQFLASVGDAYSDFRSSDVYKKRQPMVVVGANDGMLHVFDADTGDEMMAYIPTSAFDQLYRVTKPDYTHQYYVDGTARLGDAWLGSQWRTLAVATGGAGGNSVFALDITNPEALGADSFLWEYSNSKMGKLVQQPALVPLPNGKFGVVVTSGYDAPQAEAYIWILDAKTGQEIKEIELPSGELGTPFVIDLDRDRIADRIYVGGSDGKLWRIDMDESMVSKWGSPFKASGKPAPFFTAVDANGDSQPITSPLNAVKNQDGDPVILFGTGSFIRINDGVLGGMPQTNTFYGVFDENQPIIGRSELNAQNILGETQKGSFAARAVSQNPLGANDKGWYLDLVWQQPNGERVVSRASIQGQQVIFSTLIPSSDPCKAGGDSWIMALNIKSGGRWASDFFDYNQDGVIDDKDSIEVTIKDDNGQEITITLPGSGIKEEPGSGIIKSPAVVASDTGERYVCFAGSSDTIPKCILMQGGLERGRQSWRELIEN